MSLRQKLESGHIGELRPRPMCHRKSCPERRSSACRGALYSVIADHGHVVARRGHVAATANSSGTWDGI